VVPNGDRRCWGVGPNYWRTFDGLEFLFSGRCVYTLFNDGLCTVTVDMSGCSSFSNCRKVSELHSRTAGTQIGDWKFRPTTQSVIFLQEARLSLWQDDRNGCIQRPAFDFRLPNENDFPEWLYGPVRTMVTLTLWYDRPTVIWRMWAMAARCNFTFKIAAKPLQMATWLLLTAYRNSRSSSPSNGIIADSLWRKV